jgi:REP element-mobilizing transposase RayT
LISGEIAQFLIRYLPAIAEQESAKVLAGGMVTTHIHLLLKTSFNTDVPKLVQRLKGGSSRVAGRDGIGKLRWAKGYSATSISPKGLPALLAYLESQPRRHPTEKISGWEAGFFSLIPELEP